MDKMKMETVSLTERNIDKVAEMFPNVVTEVKDADGTVRRAIDFDALKAELSADAVEGREFYEFTWAGKTDAKIEASKSIRKTLRPCKEESKNWDTTQNLYIEGDNLDVLKLLQESYLGKVKMIYIDPPYNTGNDFVYADDFRMKQDEYEEMLDLTDDDGNRMIRNPETLGRFHSNWCSMIYSRLKLARNLLTDDGVIFISIDDNEQANLKKICDEIFGADNFVANVVWKRKRGRDNSAKWFSKAHEYLSIYAKDINKFQINYLELDAETKAAYKNPDNDPRGNYRVLGLWARGTQGGVNYSYTSNSGHFFTERKWLCSLENLKKLDDEDKLIIHGDNVYRKMFIFENKGKIPETLWDNVSNAANAADEIKKIFGNIIFDTPKPIPYIQEMLRVATKKEDIVLDFFSGSATTAHAVMQLNAEDGGNRKFIMVQVSEKCDEKSEAFKAGYKNICEIGKERIRRAGEKIVAETGKTDLDIGFRVLKLASTNMKDVYYTPAELTQKLLANTENNIKDDRTDMDLLYGCLLDWGVELSLPHETKQIGGCSVHFVNRTDLIACFDANIPETVVRAIAAEKPVRVVFRDSSFKNISDKNNVTEIFKAVSPDTTVKVI